MHCIDAASEREREREREREFICSRKHTAYQNSENTTSRLPEKTQSIMLATYNVLHVTHIIIEKGHNTKSQNIKVETIQIYIQKTKKFSRAMCINSLLVSSGGNTIF